MQKNSHKNWSVNKNLFTKMAVAVLVKLPAEECLDQKTVVNLHCKFNMRDLKKFSQCIKYIFEQ